MSYPVVWSAGCVGLLLVIAAIVRGVEIFEGWRTNVRTDREIAARMNVSLAAARRELTEPAAAPYVAPVLGIRIGSRHPAPVEHLTLPEPYRPAHASPETAATPLDYRGWHWRTGEITAEFHRIVGEEFPVRPPSYVGSA